MDSALFPHSRALFIPRVRDVGPDTALSAPFGCALYLQKHQGI